MPKSLKPPEKTSNECGLSLEAPKSINQPTAFEDFFAETLLNNEWVKVKIVERNVRAGGGCLVQRLDGRGQRFMVNTEDLATPGSNDPESEWQIRKRVEYDKLEELLEKEGYTIEKIVEDGNCLFRATARQLLGDEEKHQQI